MKRLVFVLVLSGGALCIAACSGTGGSMTSTMPVSQTSTSAHPFTTQLYVPGSENSVRNNRDANMLYLQAGSGKNAARIGLDLDWGAAVTALTVGDTNYINAHDTGRDVQPSVYDGNDEYTCWNGPSCTWGWNPVQAGDEYLHGSPVRSKHVTSTSLYTRTQPLQWDPDDNGGGPNKPILSDTYFDQTVTVASTSPPAFRLHYRLYHFGTDWHYEGGQEFPATYVPLAYGALTFYGGTAPWTSGKLTRRTISGSFKRFFFYTSEQWNAYTDASGNGLTVYVPGEYNYVSGFRAGGSSGPDGSGTNYFAPGAFYTFGPKKSLEGDIYLIPGNVAKARELIYSLHKNLAPADPFEPMGNTDCPAPKSKVSGTTDICGWTFAYDGRVASVGIFVDGKQVGTAQYGVRRPDVVKAWPHAPLHCGFSFNWDTTMVPNGKHVINVEPIDQSGKQAVFSPVPVTVKN